MQEAYSRGAKTWQDAWNSHDTNRFLSLYTDDVEFGTVTMAKPVHGKDELGRIYEEWINAFPDARIEIKNVIPAGDKLVVEWQSTGTQRRDLWNMPATGRNFTIDGISVLTLKDDRISSEHDYWNEASLLRQLGLMREAAPQMEGTSY